MRDRLLTCWLAQFDEGECEYRADGQPDRAHLIPKQRMRIRHFPEDVLFDPRCWIPACRRHHARFDHRFFSLTRDQIPPSLEDFAEEHGLVWSLDRDYGPTPKEAESDGE